MNSSLKTALLVAVPVEAINFCLLSWKVGEPFPDHFVPKLLAVQWVAVHWLGILLLNALYHMGSTALSEVLVVLLGGYLETVALLCLVVFVVHRFARHRHPPHRAIHS